VKALQLSGPADCERYRALVHALLDDEVAHGDRVRLEAHEAACPECARRRIVEEGLGRALRARLQRAPAPEGLDRRIRDAFRHAESGRSGGRSHRAAVPLAAVAAVLALALLSVLTLGRQGSAPAGAAGAAIPVARAVTVVDLVCDAHRVPFDAQRLCRQPGHVNALKLDDGSYWGILGADPASRDLVENRALRGRLLRVRGTLYPAIRSIAVTDVGTPEISWRSRTQFPRSAAVSDRLATLPKARPGPVAPARGDA